MESLQDLAIMWLAEYCGSQGINPAEMEDSDINKCKNYLKRERPNAEEYEIDSAVGTAISAVACP